MPLLLLEVCLSCLFVHLLVWFGWLVVLLLVFAFVCLCKFSCVFICLVVVCFCCSDILYTCLFIFVASTPKSLESKFVSTKRGAVGSRRSAEWPE